MRIPHAYQHEIKKNITKGIVRYDLHFHFSLETLVLLLLVVQLDRVDPPG